MQPYSATSYLTSLSSDHLPFLAQELKTLGVELKNQEPDDRARSVGHRILSSPVVFVDNSATSYWGLGSTTVVHHHHPAVQTSPQDHRKQERMVALGVFTAIAATIMSYFIGRSYNALSEAKTTRDVFARYTCEGTPHALPYGAIERAIESIVASRTWAIIDRVALVAGLILVTVGALTPLMPLVALGGAIVFAGALSEAFRFGIHGLEGRQQKKIAGNFRLLENGLSREARSPVPSAPGDNRVEVKGDGHRGSLYPAVSLPDPYHSSQATGYAASGIFYGQPVK